MKLFKCQACDHLVYFENRACERCGHRLGYLPELGTLSALEPDGGTTWRALARSEGSDRFCANAEFDACNWLVPATSGEAYCTACRHNGVIPDPSVPANLAAWRVMELAKHRLFYTLRKLRLPLVTRAEDPEHGLIFEFLAEPPANDGPKVMTGHDEGLITIALSEANDLERERRRTAMGEPYRTLLGHFRHEVGHHYWDLLVRDGGRLEACRAVFGDEREDYGEALQRHYRTGAPADWQERFVSAYATTHPWEDFAETWAHYLHIVDTIEMAEAFGIRVGPPLDDSGTLSADFGVDADSGADIGQVVEDWLPLTFALNSLNRCMGQPDLYPFIISPPVVEKLGFIHDLVRDAGQ
jgi:hypothetical protein